MAYSAFGSGGVTSWNGRTAAVTPAAGDYSAAMVSNAVDTTATYANPAWLTSLAGARITGNIPGNAAGLTSTLSVGAGGTGATTQPAAINALLPPQSGQGGKVIGTDGSNVSWVTPTIASPLAIASGGTGATTQVGALTNLLPARSARVYNGSTQTMTTAVWLALAYSAVRWDNSAFWSASFPTRFTAPVAGVYLITGCCQIATNGTGIRAIRALLNGATVLSTNMSPANAASDTHVQVATVYSLAAGDYVEIQVYQSSGGNLATVITPNTSPESGIAYLHP